MRGITIAAIAAAAGVGIIAAILISGIPASRGVGDTVQPPIQNDTQQQPVYRKLNVTVNGIPLVADIAETGDERTKGLSVKESMNENESMLFVFDKASDYSFWMKGMKFPLDIIWLDSDNEVIYIAHNLEPCVSDACPLFKPEGDAKYVLETVAGFADKHGVEEGTVVDFDPALLR